MRSALATLTVTALLASAASAQPTKLRVVDYATMPMTGAVDFPSDTANSAYLARVNFMADEPGGDRFFVNDLNGPLYILDKTTKQFTSYLDFNGRDGRPGMFNEFVFSSGFANGLITFQFDPDYGNNGKFYTVHMEQPSTMPGTFGPDNSNVPGLNTAGYTTTSAVTTPTSGGTSRATVLIEWTDTNASNTSFEGTARELLRVNMSGQIHPMGDLIFNPTAGPGDPDWRVMYISIGDGGAGENGDADVRRTPQLLNTMGGKILRIVPDLNEHTGTSTVSPNGRYRIPSDNPFTDVSNTAVRDEIFALGLRNPHRMAWDVDPADPNNNHMIISDIGLNTWEELNILEPGANYGYSQREGNQVLITNNSTGPLPDPDTIPNDVICTGGSFDNCTTNGTVTPVYPVAQYGHEASVGPIKGDAISSGYVYRGSNIPALYGKFLFGEVTTGQILYCDYAEMLAAHADGDPNTQATIHALDIEWDNPNDTPDMGFQTYTTTNPGGGVLGPMFHIVERAYEGRGGLDPNLPGSASVTAGNGRSDIRIQIGEDGELYVLSKSDGMIRQIVAVPQVPGDFNYDGVVDGGDYRQWSATFGTTVATPGLWADGNEDGVIDAADYAVWRTALPGGGGAIASVPEPASAGVMLSATMLVTCCRRRRMPASTS